MAQKKTQTEQTRGRQFSLRTLLAVSTGAAFIAFVANWLLFSFVAHWLFFSNDGRLATVIAFVVPWALGSFGGIAVAVRRNRSTLAGAIIGGTLGTLIHPGLMILYFYLNGLNRVRSLNGLCMLLALAACGSGLLAAFVGIPREGLQLRRKGG